MSRGRGRRAEDRAERFLRRRGLSLVARNHHCRFGELDLVMVEDKILVIVEVRLRTRHLVCSAAESVDARKQARIVMATRHFVAGRPEFREWPIRFDLVAFSGDASDNSVKWTPDAFRP